MSDSMNHSVHFHSDCASSDECIPCSSSPSVQCAPLIELSKPPLTKPPSSHINAQPATSAASSYDPTPVSAWKTPKHTLLSVMKAGMAKAALPWWQTVLLGWSSGIYIGFAGAVALMTAAGFSEFPQPILSKLAYGLTFPVGLVFIVLGGSELFTGNVMYLGTAWLSGKAGAIDCLRNITIVYFTNFLGSVAVAYILIYVPQLSHTEPVLTYLEHLALKKMSSGWGTLVLKGVGCNWLVCIALWCNLTCEDVVSKIFAMCAPITAFVLIGFEHCIANMFTVPLALMETVSGKTFGDFVALNLIPVTIGNMIGGFIFAFTQWIMYKDYAAASVANLTIKHKSN